MRLFSYRDPASILSTTRYHRAMGNFDWQLIAVLISIAAAVWSMVTRLRNLFAGKGGCGDCSKANSVNADSSEPKLVSEDQIQMFYETKK
jgi:hypothetical protein